MVNEVLRQVVAIDKSLQHPDFLIDTADVGDKSETSIHCHDAIDTPMGRDHQVRGKARRIDYHHSDGTQVKQLQVRRANLHAGLSQHFQSVGADLQREHTAEPEQFQAERVVVVEVRNMEDQLASDSNQERHWLNIIALREVSTVFAHACQSQRLRLNDIRSIELQVCKCCCLDAERIQCFEPRLQFGHTPQVQPLFSGFNHQTRCHGPNRPQP